MLIILLDCIGACYPDPVVASNTGPDPSLLQKSMRTCATQCSLHRYPPLPLVLTQLRVVILPIDKSGEMSRMLDRHQERRRQHCFMQTNFEVSFMTLSEAESYHPLVAATLHCESQLLEWHGHRSHEQQAKRLLGHDDGCLNRPDGPGECVCVCV